MPKKYGTRCSKLLIRLSIWKGCFVAKSWARPSAMGIVNNLQAMLQHPEQKLHCDWARW
jgi:hypothetical protein